MNQRDRDTAGRPRNARPRDELGRPLPRGAAAGVPGMPDDLTMTPDEAVALGGSLLAEGRPFHAHEVFEAAWKASRGPDRELWRGMAQIAVGLTHARRGNAAGAVSLLRQGAGRVRGFADPAGPASSAGSAGSAGSGGVAGLDPEFVAASAADIAARIERDGLPAVPAAALRLALRRGAP